jgi:putative transcriptional regulator
MVCDLSPFGRFGNLAGGNPPFAGDVFAGTFITLAASSADHEDGKQGGHDEDSVHAANSNRHCHPRKPAADFGKGMAEEFRSLKGQLLLDSGQLRGSFFHRSVVLVCHHDREGAFGLVLNQPSENKVGDVLLADLPESLKDEVLYIGGPVQTNALTYLHADSFLPDANVIANLSMGHSLDDLQEVSASFSGTRRVRCFAGYAGWSGGQLESEMERKAWLLHPASIDFAFAEQAKDLWKRILLKKGWKYRLLAETPEDVSWN